MIVAALAVVGVVAIVAVAGVPGAILDERADSGDQITIDGGVPVELPASASATVAGSVDLASDTGTAEDTNLTPGEEIDLRLESTNESDDAFLQQASAEVDDDGEFEATFDLRGISSDQPAELSLRTAGDELGGDELVRVDARIVDGPDSPNGDDGDDDRDDGDDDRDEAVTFDEEPPIEVAASENATVSATADAEAGTELDVRLRSTDGDSPGFLKSTVATVEDDGAFTAEFDLSDVTSEREAELTVRDGEGDVDATADVRVIAPPDGFAEESDG